jgi:sec-independent protein translocase protein TatA
MGELFAPWHLVVIVVIALLIFGPRKLPELGKGLGEGLRGFKEAIKGGDAKPAGSANAASDAHTVTPQPAATAPIQTATNVPPEVK